MSQVTWVISCLVSIGSNSSKKKIDALDAERRTSELEDRPATAAERAGGGHSRVRSKKCGNRSDYSIGAVESIPNTRQSG
jgi:hypothetical protein